MEMTCQEWDEGTGEFVTHNILAEYIQNAAKTNDILDCISFNTRVNQVKKVGSLWELEVARLVGEGREVSVVDSVEVPSVQRSILVVNMLTRSQHFDAVVVATGHYHAPNIPDIPGLAEWKSALPNQVSHSKRYRSNQGFENQNVLLVGAGVSSIDIARDLGSTAASIYQSSRSGPYDLPSHLLPPNAARVGGIESFDPLSTGELCDDGIIPGTVTLRSGQKLCGVHRVIVCTGYHVSFPFMRNYHTDFIQPEDASETVLVTDGQQTHNLHKDIFYIPDPTLAFIGVPYHVATFTLFEFQAMALAAVYSGDAKLPSTASMRNQYRERLKQKGAGRFFHSLKKRGDEIAYVNDLVAMVNEGGNTPVVAMKGHSEKWLEAYVRRGVRMVALFSTARDPDIDKRVLERMYGC
jgi:thioredoxin reductase